jgi:hypothetical protein
MMNQIVPKSEIHEFSSQTDAVLDQAHKGDIHGAFGSIAQHDLGARQSIGHRLRTLLAIIGPGLIVMVGDNDAGAFDLYSSRAEFWYYFTLDIIVIDTSAVCKPRNGCAFGYCHRCWSCSFNFR